MSFLHQTRVNGLHSSYINHTGFTHAFHHSRSLCRKKGRESSLLETPHLFTLRNHRIITQFVFVFSLCFIFNSVTQHCRAMTTQTVQIRAQTQPLLTCRRRDWISRLLPRRGGLWINIVISLDPHPAPPAAEPMWVFHSVVMTGPPADERELKPIKPWKSSALVSNL